ncbi:1-(5-phosphoribosyl)-5-amino-4-imidazole-carboxylate carboxylase [Clostridiales bacterium PH28_bin88]|nr:1-(5-phosphoribosyl)-5-amino-4-imidazole-carboxylate carboxylase [Clostridiales bacterium PH28_bin88]
MHTQNLVKLLEDYKAGTVSLTRVLEELKKLPYEDLEFAKVDHHRALRNGFPEVIFCQGKTVEQVVKIFQSLAERNRNILATRAGQDMFNAIQPLYPRAKYHETARIISMAAEEVKISSRKILVLSAGTADIPVAEEAVVTAEVMGHQVERVYDVGVAGIHRLLAHYDRLNSAAVIIVVAGMEGALASVVGGLVDVPVIAVPTSVGYGASFNGLSALLTMLNSCAKGIGVVNIDNGFGAAALADTIIRSGLKGCQES